MFEWIGRGRPRDPQKEALEAYRRQYESRGDFPWFSRAALVLVIVLVLIAWMMALVR